MISWEEMEKVKRGCENEEKIYFDYANNTIANGGM